MGLLEKYQTPAIIVAVLFAAFLVYMITKPAPAKPEHYSPTISYSSGYGYTPMEANASIYQVPVYRA